jgi:hypothetical protein
MLAEITGKIDGFDSVVAGGRVLDGLPGVCRAAVVYQNDLERRHQRLKRRD